SGAVVDLAIGGVVAAPMLNPRGGVEALPAIARLGPESFLLLAGPEQITRLTSWIDWDPPASGARLVDLTPRSATPELRGPRALSRCRALPGNEPDPGPHRRLACEFG